MAKYARLFLPLLLLVGLLPLLANAAGAHAGATQAVTGPALILIPGMVASTTACEQPQARAESTFAAFLQRLNELGDPYASKLYFNYDAAGADCYTRADSTQDLHTSGELLQSMLSGLTGASQIDILAHSMGGAIVLTWAADHPDLAKQMPVRLVTLDSPVNGCLKWSWLCAIGADEAGLQLADPAFQDGVLRVGPQHIATYTVGNQLDLVVTVCESVGDVPADCQNVNPATGEPALLSQTSPSAPSIQVADNPFVKDTLIISACGADWPSCHSAVLSEPSVVAWAEAKFGWDFHVSNVQASPSQFNPRAGEATTVSFSLNSPGRAALLIFDFGGATVFDSGFSDRPAGVSSFTWTGQLQSVADGPYAAVVVAIDSSNRTAWGYDIVTADSGQPPVVSGAISQQQPGGSLGIQFAADKFSLPILFIAKESGQTIRWVWGDSFYYAGGRQLVWDLKDMAGDSVPMGTYSIATIAVDTAGRFGYQVVAVSVGAPVVPGQGSVRQGPMANPARELRLGREQVQVALRQWLARKGLALPR